MEKNKAGEWTRKCQIAGVGGVGSGGGYEGGRAANVNRPSPTEKASFE